MATKEIPVVWLQGATCSGCSVSALNTIAPTIKNVLVDEAIPGQHINLRFQATVMAGQGDPAIQVLEDTAREKKGGYVFILEGSIPTADNGVFCHIGEKDGHGVPLADRVAEMAENALACLAIGTCAAFGGIFAAAPNRTGCMGLGAFLKAKGIRTPVVAIPGCPPHPDWFIGTIAHILLNGLPGADDVDDLGRLRLFFGTLIHDHCQRRADFDAGRFAKKHGDPGCLMELGCKGYVTYADCPTRKWNDSVNWCIQCGGACIGCSEPSFPDILSPLYEKMTYDRIPGLRSEKPGGPVKPRTGVSS